MNGSMITKLSVIIALAMLSACAKIKPDEIGVRTINVGSKGIVAKDYDPGHYTNFWPLETWHRYPRTIQNLRFTQGTFSPQDQTERPITVTSSDGDRVQMNIEIFYHIADNQAHKVVQDSGFGDSYKQLVRDLSIESTRAVFGQMKTEDFYNPIEREKMRQIAREYLADRLAPRGFNLVNFLVVTLEFDSGYENLIRQKKIADQMVSLELSKKLAAEQRGHVEMIQEETEILLREIVQESQAIITRMKAEGDKKIAELTTEARQYALQLEADANFYKMQKEAKSTTLLKNSEADGTRRLNQALVGPGGSNLTALEAARNLRLNDVVFPSFGFDWFNPNQMAQHLGAELMIQTDTPLDRPQNDADDDNSGETASSYVPQKEHP